MIIEFIAAIDSQNNLKVYCIASLNNSFRFDVAAYMYWANTIGHVRTVRSCTLILNISVRSVCSPANMHAAIKQWMNQKFMCATFVCVRLYVYRLELSNIGKKLYNIDCHFYSLISAADSHGVTWVTHSMHTTTMAYISFCGLDISASQTYNVQRGRSGTMLAICQA